MKEAEVLLPQPGDRYLHYKGTVYTVICVASSAVSRNEKVVVYSKDEKVQLPVVAQHTETGKQLIIFQGEEVPSSSAIPHESDESVWARPPENFLELLGVGTTHCYRFQKIEDIGQDNGAREKQEGSRLEFIFFEAASAELDKP